MTASFQKGKRVENQLEDPAFSDLGFSTSMSLLQVRHHVKRLNARDKLKRDQDRKKSLSSENLNLLCKTEQTIIPENDNVLFIKHLQEDWFGETYNLRKQIFVWNKCQKMLTSLLLFPEDYYSERRRIYKYLENNKISLSYAKKILLVLNKYGEWRSRHYKSFFKRVPIPKGKVRESLLEKSNTDGSGAKPFTESILNKMRGKLPDGQLEYLEACFYLGLRPSELDLVLKDKSKFNERVIEGVTIICVYQKKLSGVSQADRWKYIPLIIPKQVECFSNIKNGKLKKPLVKTIKKIIGKGYGLYSGRKGFVDLMLGLDQRIEDVSMWLGHKSLEITWKVYKDKQKVSWKKVSGGDE